MRAIRGAPAKWCAVGGTPRAAGASWGYLVRRGPRDRCSPLFPPPTRAYQRQHGWLTPQPRTLERPRRALRAARPSPARFEVESVALWAAAPRTRDGVPLPISRCFKRHRSQKKDGTIPLTSRARVASTSVGSSGKTWPADPRRLEFDTTARHGTRLTTAAAHAAVLIGEFLTSCGVRVAAITIRGRAAGGAAWAARGRPAHARARAPRVLRRTIYAPNIMRHAFALRYARRSLPARACAPRCSVYPSPPPPTLPAQFRHPPAMAAAQWSPQPAPMALCANPAHLGAGRLVSRSFYFHFRGGPEA